MKKVNILFQYLSYKLFGCHARGHGVHSPFVFDFVINVLNTDRNNDDFKEIEEYRKKIIRRKDIAEILDFGAGSKKENTNRRIVGKAVKAASIKPKFGRLLYRIVQHYRPEKIIELGTNAGLGTMYLAKANLSTPVMSIEGDPFFANLAKKGFSDHHLKNITVINNTFENALPSLLKDEPVMSALIYIDGNHRKEPAISYFNAFAEKADENTIIIFDDIRWSEEMQEAWETIKSDKRVSVSIDLFFMGIVFFRKNIIKQNFKIKF